MAKYVCEADGRPVEGRSLLCHECRRANDLLRQTFEWVDDLDIDDPEWELDLLAGLATLRRRLDVMISGRVGQAGLKGASTAEVGAALGISRQAVHHRWPVGFRPSS